jgi:hypothetical protein
MSHTMKTTATLAAVGALALVVVAPVPAAQAVIATVRQCFFNSGPDGDAVYANHGGGRGRRDVVVRPGRSMNCTSARYVARRLIRQWNRHREFDRTRSDGYVTWHGRVIGRRSTGEQIIRYSERRSGTSITFDWERTEL